MSERWLPVVGFEGEYEVSDCGRVRSLDRTSARGARYTSKIIASHPQGLGHLSVHLYRDGAWTKRYVHRMVLESFVGPCPRGWEALHSPDRSPFNCRLGNLRWGTRLENAADALSHGTRARGESIGNSKLNATDVERIRDMVRNGVPYKKIAPYMQISIGSISMIVNRLRWAHL